MTVVAEEYAPAQGRVAVLGLGTMGAGMARSLLRAGKPVDVWNRTPERAADLELSGHDLVCLAVPARSLPSVLAAQGERIPKRAGLCWRGVRHAISP